MPEDCKLMFTSERLSGLTGYDIIVLIILIMKILFHGI